ncbi:MAG: hypothetical protein LH481_10600 [Burkholderiales bacterium]|nr:hypothetical protein [Burkholderiales bacterium]
MLFKQIKLVLLLVMAYVATTDATAATVDEFKKNFFNGRITPEAVEKFIAEHPSGTIQKLVIGSTGGDAFAGLRLGNWVRQNGLDVEVYVICQSACANYVFPAGKKKIIGERALVLWHGSIEQKYARELQSKHHTLLVKHYQTAAAVSTDERKYLDDNQVAVESALRLREQQGRFFDAIQVNEYITRLGQEPVDFGIDSWTTTVIVMEKFGIRNVEAPANYGSRDYLRRISLSSFHCGGKCVTFELDESGQARRIE